MREVTNSRKLPYSARVCTARSPPGSPRMAPSGVMDQPLRPTQPSQVLPSKIFMQRGQGRASSSASERAAGRAAACQ